MGDFGPARREIIIDIPESVPDDPGELEQEEEKPVEVPAAPELVPA